MNNIYIPKKVINIYIFLTTPWLRNLNIWILIKRGNISGFLVSDQHKDYLIPH